MIPLFAVLRIHTSRRPDPRSAPVLRSAGVESPGVRKFGLWLPLFLLWLLLLPLALLLLPFFVIGCLVARMNPWRVFIAAWQLITGLRGTHIEFEQAKSKVLLRIM
jgi:hypothetical protein